MSQVERSSGPPSLRRWDPFRELDDFRERMSRMLEQTFGAVSERGSWSPLVDVEETEDAFVFEADVPGVRRDDLSVEVDGNELRITGEIKERQREGVVRRQARMTGRFEYRSTLPRDVDPDRIEATLADGVLTVRVPKSERTQPRRIDIRAGERKAGGEASPPTGPSGGR